MPQQAASDPPADVSNDPGAKPPHPPESPDPPPSPGPTDPRHPSDPPSISILAAHAFARLMRQAFDPGDPLRGDYHAVAADLIARLDPQDPAEEMLVAQMVMTHGRIQFLSRNANQQKNSIWFARFQGELDKAMHLYRRQLLALAEHRRPRRSSFTSIRTAHIAAQQVVESRRRRKKLHAVSGGTRVPALPQEAQTQTPLPAD